MKIYKPQSIPLILYFIFNVTLFVNIHAQDLTNYEFSIENGVLIITNEADGATTYSIPSLSLIDSFDSGGNYKGIDSDNNLTFIAAGGKGIYSYNPQNFGEFSYFNTSGSSIDLSINENYLYVADRNGGLLTFDISEYSFSDNLEYFQVDQVAGIQPVDVFANDNLLLVKNFGSTNKFYVYDISNGSDPIIIDIVENIQSLKNFTIQGDKLLVIHNESLNIYQISNNVVSLISTITNDENGNPLNNPNRVFLISDRVYVGGLNKFYSFSFSDGSIIPVNSQNIDGLVIDITVHEGNAYILTENSIDVISLAEDAPTIGSTSISDNTQITVNFSEDVYSNINGSGDLDANDFALTLNDPDNVLSLETFTVSKISDASYNFFFEVSGVISGNETITVNPQNDSEGNYSIYSGIGVPMSITQNNNVVYLEGPSYITSTTISQDNVVTVNFSDDVYSTDSEQGDLSAEDFNLSLSNSSEVTVSQNPTSVQKISQSEWALSLEINGFPIGTEILTVNPNENSIFNSQGLASESNQNNNSVTLNSLPTSSAMFIVSQLAVDNSFVEITPNVPLYSDSQQSELNIADFKLTIQGGVATFESDMPAGIQNDTESNSFKLFLTLIGETDGNERLTINPRTSSSIVDANGLALSNDIMTIPIRLFPHTISANTLDINGQVNASSVTAGQVVISSNSIGIVDDPDLITFTGEGEVAVQGEIFINSDERLKTNIVSLGHTLIKLLTLDGKRYKMINDDYDDYQIGLLAQDVQKVFPDLVLTDSKGILSVNYQALIPVLLNALKEMDEKYKELENELLEIEKLID